MINDMRVICIRNIHYNGNLLHLTLNKTYDVLNIFAVDIAIVNDKGTIGEYSISYFITLEEFRNRQIDLIL